MLPIADTVCCDCVVVITSLMHKSRQWQTLKIATPIAIL